MDVADAEVAAYIGRWRPSSMSPDAAAFARDVITKAGPEGRERAKNLLWAAGKLADWAAGLGLDAVPEVRLDCHEFGPPYRRTAQLTPRDSR